MWKSVGGKENREKREIQEVYMTVVQSGVSISQEVETYHEGDGPEGGVGGGGGRAVTS